jgi:hypothetical protein
MFELLLPDPVEVRCDRISMGEEKRQICVELASNAAEFACLLCHKKSG